MSDKSFLGIGVSTPLASLHLHYQTDNPESNPLRKLLQLTTNGTGNAAGNGFAVFSDYTTKDIYFKQQESAKFFIEGPGGGFMIAPTGKIGIGTTEPKQKVHLDEGNLLITSINSGTTNTPTGALLFSDVISELYSGKWGIEYLNSNDPVYGGTGLNFRRYFVGFGGVGTSSSPTVLFLSDKENVGIGTKTPKAKLDIAGSFKASSADITGSLGVGIATPQQKLHVHNGNILLTNDLNSTNEEKNALVFGYDEQPPLISIPAKWGIERVGTEREYGLNFWKYGYYAPAKEGDDTRGMEYRSVMFFDDSDNVGIGTENPDAKLDVNGTFKAQSATIAGKITANDMRIENLLCAKEIKVQLSNNCWPDYVFSKDYNLMPLNEVEQFIAENQHLPSVPSAAEVEVNGIELGEMNATLLKKVEELTLYIIQMEKRLLELESMKGGK